MPIKYIGNALSKKPGNKLGWFPRALIPISSVEQIPTRQGQLESSINVPPVLANVSIKGSPLPNPDEQEFTPFPWERINLTNFQLDLYYMVTAEGYSYPGAHPPYTQIADDSEYGLRFESSKEHDSQQKGRQFIVQQFYLGSSREFTNYVKDSSNLLIRNDRENIGDIENPQGTFQNKPAVSRLNVWYVLGRFMNEAERERASAKSNARQQAATVAEAELAKPTVISIKRQTEDFTKASISAESISLTKENEYNEEIIPKVKFVFDNGVEKYAEVVQVDFESEFQISNNITTAEQESVGESSTTSTQQLDLSDTIENDQAAQEQETESTDVARQQFFSEASENVDLNTNRDAEAVVPPRRLPINFTR